MHLTYPAVEYNEGCQNLQWKDVVPRVAGQVYMSEEECKEYAASVNKTANYQDISSMDDLKPDKQLRGCWEHGSLSVFFNEGGIEVYNAGDYNEYEKLLPNPKVPLGDGGSRRLRRQDDIFCNPDAPESERCRFTEIGNGICNDNCFNVLCNWDASDDGIQQDCRKQAPCLFSTSSTPAPGRRERRDTTSTPQPDEVNMIHVCARFAR